MLERAFAGCSSLRAAAFMMLVAAAEAGCSAAPPSDDAEAEASAAALFPGGRISSAELARAWPIADDGEESSDANANALAGTRALRSTKPVACAPGKRGKRGDRVVGVTSSKLLRTALVHVPRDYDPEKGTTLVLNFHGFTSDAAQQAILSRMNRASEKRNFIVVYPQGLGRSWNAGACCGQAWVDAVDDVAYVRALLDELEESYCIDTKRVFATGMSNGGFFSHRLACEVSDRIAAIAPVAGVYGSPSSACKPKRPVPVLELHGTWDPLVPYSGGLPLVRLDIPAPISFPSVAKTVTDWKNRNGCSAGPTTTFANGDTDCVTWSGCDDDADVVLCTTRRGGHTWPGGVPVPVLGKTTTALDATETMLTFFASHPMP